MKIAKLLLLIWMPVCAVAQQSTTDAAQQAAIRLEAAAVMLSEVDRAQDRAAALTETVQAYEEGLAALRDGLRQVAIRQQALGASLDAKSNEVAELLAVLQAMGRSPAPLLLLHPLGPVGTARSGMLLSDVTPALQAEVEVLRSELQEANDLQVIQLNAAKTLQSGLEGAQNARADLSAAMAERTELPLRFSEDPVQTALLIASTETLDAFADGLGGIISGESDIAQPDASDRAGQLPWPVAATMVRRFEEADSAGITRPGWLLATRPRALVTTPAAATIRYFGPLLDYGVVAILEPAPETLWVIAGMSEVFGEIGEVLGEGAALGLMGGNPAGSNENVTNPAQGAGPVRSETLYIEVRVGNVPVDPIMWFMDEAR